MPLYKLLLKSVSVFANGSDENAEEGRTVAWCLHSVCHGIISDWLWKYGDLWTNLSLSVSLCRSLSIQYQDSDQQSLGKLIKAVFDVDSILIFALR